MSNCPTLLIDFPRTADRSLLSLGFGLAGMWGSALYAFGSNVLIIDAPGDADPERARLQGRVTLLARDRERPTNPDALMFLRLEPAHPYPVVHVRLKRDGEIVYERCMGGDARRLVRGCESVVIDVADELGLGIHPIHWRELFAPAITPSEALQTLEQVGALALHNRARPTRSSSDLTTAPPQLH